MSPNGEKVPPALAATTIFIHDKVINFLLSPSMAITTAPMSRAVVRLSAIGEITKERKPVIQKTALKENPFETSRVLRA